LNRHQYFVTLGKAYWYTKDEKYAIEFTLQVLDWIRNNPPQMGINWISSLEISIRLISWILGYHFFKNSTYFVEKGLKEFLKSVYEQVRHLRCNLSPLYKAGTNHIIGEACGLIIVAIVFPEFKEAEEWLRTGVRILTDKLDKQIYADGINYEQSSSYHRFVVDFLMLVSILARNNNVGISSVIEKKLEKMLEYIMYITPPNGETPAIGDSDSGRAYKLDYSANFWDFRSTLAVGAVLFNREDMKYVSGGFPEEAFWLLGKKGYQRYEAIQAEKPEETSKIFQEGGVVVLRDCWSGDSDFFFIKCGNSDKNYPKYDSHSHCDYLSFVLHLKGVPIFTDSGTYTYNGEKKLRDYFRLTSAHNTVKISNFEQASPEGIFAWTEMPEGAILEADFSGERDVIVC